MRLVSLNARQARDATSTDELEVVLVIIEHPALDEPVRLSSDNTEMLSVEPLTYCTRSTWRTEDGSPFLFVLLEALIPDENDAEETQASLVLEILDSRIAEILTGTTVPATVHMAVVLASTPDLVEQEFVGMELTGAEGDGGQVALRFGYRSTYAEPFPGRRMTKEAFPGLHA